MTRPAGNGSEGREPDRTGAVDPDSQAWLSELASAGVVHDRAVARLHGLLLRVARVEAGRRWSRLPEDIRSEVDDLCVQAASDATMAVVRKLDGFRGAARFTTWASKFAILELSTRLRRRAWRDRAVRTDPDDWAQLTDRSPSMLEGLEHREMVDALHRAVRDGLTKRQRVVFRCAVLDDVPIDVLAERLQSTRGAIYKTLHDARSKLRTELRRAGVMEDSAP